MVLIEAADGEQVSGPTSIARIEFDQTCSIWLDKAGYSQRIIDVPSDLSDYERLGLCTSITIERLQILNSEGITSLQFMENITVYYSRCIHTVSS